MARTLERLRKQYAAKPGDMQQKGPRQGPPGRGMTGKPKNAGQTIRRLMSYVSKYWYKLVLVLLCMLVTTVTSLCGGYLMAPIIDHLTLAVKPDAVITMSPIEKIADGVLNRITAGETVQNWIASGTIQAVSAYVAVALIVLAAIYGIGIITTYTQARLMMSVSLKVIESIRNDLFEKMQTLSVRYYDSHPTGELMSRYTNDIDNIDVMINNSLVGLVSGLISLVGTFIFMVTTSWVLTLVTIAFIPVFLFGGMMIAKRSAKYYAAQQAALLRHRLQATGRLVGNAVHRHGAVVGNDHALYAVAVVFLGKRHGQHAACVAHRRLSGHGLCLVYVAQSHVVEPVAQPGSIDTFLSAHHDALAVFQLGHFGSRSIEVGLQHQPCCRAETLTGGTHQVFEEQADGLALPHALRQVFSTQEGDGQHHHGGGVVGGFAQDHHQGVHVGLVLRRTGDDAAHLDAQPAIEGGRSLQAVGRVVVAGRQDDSQTGVVGRHLGKEIVELAFGRSRRVGVVEDVAAHQQGVWVFLGHRLQQPVQEMTVLIRAVVAVEGVAKMPVGSMEYFHTFASVFKMQIYE